jgi:RNA:NAD 2'-phosphotransferase (TPT1/KptA family)
MDKISKSLSYLLRHGAVKEGVAIDAEGYVVYKHKR